VSIGVFVGFFQGFCRADFTVSQGYASVTPFIEYSSMESASARKQKTSD
jgi:hypothetical protein